jgi:hypothetical protein
MFNYMPLGRNLCCNRNKTDSLNSSPQPGIQSYRLGQLVTLEVYNTYKDTGFLAMRGVYVPDKFEIREYQNHYFKHK